MAGFKLGITSGGMTLLTKGLAGSEVRFVSIVMGDGSYAGSIADASAVLSGKAVLPISRITRRNGQVTVKGVLHFGAVEEGFIWREVGLMAIDPDTGKEVLYAYGTGGSDYIPGADEATLDERSVQLTVLVSEAENITAELDPSAIYVDMEMLEEAIGRAVVPLSHKKTGSVHALTGLSGRNGLVSCSFTASSAYVKGESFTVDGTAFSVKLQDGSEADDGLFAAGAAVAVLVDTENKTVNFKSGGGVKLPALTKPASAAQITAGYEAIGALGQLLTGTRAATEYAVKTGTISAKTSGSINVSGNILLVLCEGSDYAGGTTPNAGKQVMTHWYSSSSSTAVRKFVMSVSGKTFTYDGSAYGSSSPSTLTYYIIYKV